MKRTVRLLGLLFATLLVISACTTAEEAGQEPTEDAAPVITEPAVEPSPPTTETEPSVDVTETETEAATSTSGSILDLAAENPELSQLVAAIEAAGLTDALEQAGPITVFAPNNDAFASLNQSDLTALLADPSSLGDILQYHVVEGSYTSSDLSDGDTLTTLQGDDLTVSVDGGTVMVSGAEVVQPDLEAGNGVIHVIDGVLQP
ncbi:MAG TPA: fasciclin domain-containing protein [Euzebyales bacterium]|nr:fasciclin domain-containing protein [Euzebyales bacterium]